MDGSGLDRTDDFQKICESGLNRIQFFWIRTGLGVKKFTVHSSLIRGKFANRYGSPKTAFKEDLDTDKDIWNAFVDILWIQTLGKSCTLHNHWFIIFRSTFCALPPRLSCVYCVSSEPQYSAMLPLVLGLLIRQNKFSAWVCNWWSKIGLFQYTSWQFLLRTWTRTSYSGPTVICSLDWKSRLAVLMWSAV